MQKFKIAATACLAIAVLSACSGGAPQSANKAAADGKSAAGSPASTASAGSANEKATADDAVNELIDTAKLKSDLNNVMSTLSNGKPDTAALKAAGSDILSTAHTMLSDSGIDKLYGNSNDPAVRAAAETLKKMRNATGLTPAALDSLKKAADLLKAN